MLRRAPILGSSTHRFSGSGGVDSQGVNRAGKFLGEDFVDAPVALDAVQSGKGLRHNMDAEVRFAFQAMAGMTGVQV